MEEWIIQLMQSMGEWGTVGIFLLMTAENLFPQPHSDWYCFSFISGPPRS